MNDEKKEDKSTSTDTDKGDESTTDEKIKQLNEATERLDKANAEFKANEALKKLGGVTNSGDQPI